MSASRTSAGAPVSPSYTKLAEMAPAFLPGWVQPTGPVGSGGPIEALIQVAARYRDVLADVIARALPKAKLAHLDALGVSLRPAQPSQGVVVFTVDPTGPNGDAPIGTQVGASGASAPVVFETTGSIALVAAPLAEVKFVDIDTGLVTPLPLITGPQNDQEPIHHDLYLGDLSALAVIPGATLTVNLTLAPVAAGASQSPLSLDWEFFDGTDWHPFLPFNIGDDETNGLTQSGTITLNAGEASGAQTIVNGVGPMYWVRARAASLPNGANTLPAIANVTVASQLEPLLWALSVTSSDVAATGAEVSVFLVGEENQQLIDQNTYLSIDPIDPTNPNTPLPTGAPDSVLGNTFVASPSATLASPPTPTATSVPVSDRGDYTLTLWEVSTLPDGTKAKTQLATQAIRLFERKAYFVTATRQGELLDKAFNDTLKLDPTSTFAPFGEAPRPGSSFVFTNADAFSQPGAQVTLFYEVVSDPNNPTPVTTSPPALKQSVALDVWTGPGWTTLARSDDLPSGSPELPALCLFPPGIYSLQFTLPTTPIPVSTWAGQSGQWARLRLLSGGYGTTQTIQVPQPRGSAAVPFTIVTSVPPRLHAPRIWFHRELPPVAPQVVLSDNDWQWQDHGAGLNQAGQPFAPFTGGQDLASTLYLGFDGGLPPGTIGVDFDFNDDNAVSVSDAPALEWEYYDGSQWQSLEVQDDTASLSRSGVVQLNWPGIDEAPAVPFQTASGNVVTVAAGTVALRDDGTAVAPALAFQPGDSLTIRDANGYEEAVVARVNPDGWQLTAPLSRTYKPGNGAVVGPVRLARFGTPRSWVRVRPAEPVTSWTMPTFDAARPNAVAIEQIETHADEVLGPSTGAPGQNFLLRYHPVLAGEEMEILELSGGRASIEWQALRDEVLAARGSDQDLRYDFDPATGRISGVWVRWRSVPDFSDSGPNDRVYTIDPVIGRIVFGDGQAGLIPPPGQDSVRARLYQAGGGDAGNLPPGAVSQVISSNSVIQAVTNPRWTLGGADGETLEVSAPVPVTAQGAVSSSTTESSPLPVQDESDPITLYLARHSAIMAQGRAAITQADYEAIALDSSAAIQAVICLRPHDLPGGTTSSSIRLGLVVLAQDDENSPDLSTGLKLSQVLQNTVLSAVASSAPAWVANRIDVVGPTPIAVDVTATVILASQDPNPDVPPGTPPDRVAVRSAAESALRSFLGPRYALANGGLGWLMGTASAVALSDLALQLAGVAGVDQVTALTILQDGVSVGDRLVIPPGCVPVPGDVVVTVAPAPSTGASANGGAS